MEKVFSQSTNNNNHQNNNPNNNIMLRRSQTLQVTMRNRKKWPYMIHHNRLPWNTIEPGSDITHKILGTCILKLLQSAANMRINGLVPKNTGNNNSNNNSLPNIPEDQWLFALPSSTFVVPVSSELYLVNSNSGSSASSGDSIEFDGSSEVEQEDGGSSVSPLAPFGWTYGKRVVDELCLTHYGPIHSSVAPVKEVAEFRSPDLRLMCSAIRFGKFYPDFQIAANSSLASVISNSNDICVYHFYRPNRAATEMEAAFKQFVRSPLERPDLSALEEVVAKGANFKPTLSRKTSSGNQQQQKASPLPKGEVPTSPQYGLIEREAIRPGDTFGCRSRAWGHHW